MLAGWLAGLTRRVCVCLDRELHNSGIEKEGTKASRRLINWNHDLWCKLPVMHNLFGPILLFSRRSFFSSWCYLSRVAMQVCIC